jgi:hypothetical protein
MAYAQVLLKFGHEPPRANTAGSAPAVLRRFVSPVDMLVPFPMDDVIANKLEQRLGRLHAKNV